MDIAVCAGGRVARRFQPKGLEECGGVECCEMFVSGTGSAAVKFIAGQKIEIGMHAGGADFVIVVGALVPLGKGRRQRTKRDQEQKDNAF